MHSRRPSPQDSCRMVLQAAKPRHVIASIGPRQSATEAPRGRAFATSRAPLDDGEENGYLNAEHRSSIGVKRALTAAVARDQTQTSGCRSAALSLLSEDLGRCSRA